MTKVIPGYKKLALILASGALLLGACSSASETDTAAGDSAAASSVREGLPENCSTATPKIGVALPNLSNPYYVEMKKGVETAAAEVKEEKKKAAKPTAKKTATKKSKTV